MATMAKGACLCGAAQFEVTLPTLRCYHCHCSICRRAHMAGYGTFFQVTREQLCVTADPARLGHYQPKPAVTQTFCRTCGSALFGESTRGPGIVAVALAAMLEPIDRNPEQHIFWDDRASWVQLRDDLPRFGGPSEFGPTR